MLDEMRVNDVQLNAGDIRQLESADEIAHFFAKLRYDVDERTNIPDYAVLGMGSEDMRQHISKIELIGKDPIDGDISLYLFEVRSVTAKLRNDIARRFRERSENALLVLTQDYEELEFVLLERVVTRIQSRRAALKQAIRPIPLTVNRLHPDPVALRVLKRFTFTEEDAAYQWEKLRSAYMLAEWSEEYFNNRALFSDYYLRERLTDPKITPDWDEDVRPVGREIYKHLITARKNYTRQPEDVIRKGLYEPVFKLLGFDFAKQKSSASAAATADFLLYPPNDRSKPIAAALTYVWNRNLDDVDESRERAADDGGKPFEIPGAKVVSLLEAQVVPWVIVTNGKLWRLYSSTASNKATNYYEIDLEEAIAANDQITALKYWWLMFRREAFTGFLDKLLKDSADYAKELGGRLKDRVFVEIFPQFAKGFIADMRAKSISDLDDAALATVFSGTMTFLYRLMFILYAESLELLPLHDVRGYGERSFDRMKHEIAEAGGTLLDASPDKLSRQYRIGSTALYDRLQALFTVIDQGSDELNMPTYDGGLFTPETDSSQFLTTYAIPDRYLALGLDRLTRDIDDRTKALVFIDFKSLGVRHLGSIYEGLLEFKLRIAGEKLAVTKEKGKEVYKPARQVKKPLAIIDKDEVYLENDKQERKATGSYYTPDYIVKYIVRHTVGPVLDRKFQALENRLREAQRDYRNYVKLVEARRKAFGKDESAAVYWNNLDMQNLVDDCLNVRVLDPAMGSGHFLVEVVDYVSNRLVDFLNAWSENPVWAFLEKTRDDILNEMERQKVTIDADRLTRVSLLKRAVLKRCVYGVDLNAMAVELAKVSLWLDAFTLGAPLSFLDHHLKYGNSLIGSRIVDVKKALEGSLTLFSQNKFAGVMMATDLMRQISYLSDNTIEQTRQSAQAYRDASDHLAPYKRVLDVYTSRWFGNTPSKGKRGRSDFDPTIEFLRRDDTQAWLEAPCNPKNRLPDDDYMQAGLVAKTAMKATDEKRFFHWELEFPEVFFALSRPGRQDVQLSADGGFDAVVGNPPWGGEIDKTTYEYLKEMFADLHQRLPDTTKYFFGVIHSIIKQFGGIGQIVPNVLLYSYEYENWRNLLLEDYTLYDIINLGEGVFDDGTAPCCVITAEKSAVRLDAVVRVWELRYIQRASLPQLPKEYVVEVSQEQFKQLPNHIFVSDIFGTQLLPQIYRLSDDVRKLASSISLGVHTGANEAYILSSKMAEEHDIELEARWKILTGSDIDRYYTEQFPPHEILFIDWDFDAKSHPNTIRYLENFKIRLSQRREAKQGKMPWFALHWPRYIELYESPKIMCRQTADTLIATVDTYNYCALNSTIVIKPDSNDYSPYFWIAILNSRLQSYIYNLFAQEEDRAFAEVKPANLRKLPIRRITFTTSVNEREQLTREAMGAYDIGDNVGVLQRVQTHIDGNKADVIHDLLAHLAQRMIDLNKQKQGEIKRFLGWLEKRLQIRMDKNGATGIDSLTGKTILQGYLGDYQKGEEELPWREFYYRLFRNHTRFAVSLSDVEGEIQREYEKSLATLLPIKRDLARTDALIDKIVYRLYGLTDQEIELIERPQYEQALVDAKAQVVADEAITDDEEKIERIADGILPAARRFFERVEPTSVEELLDNELPNWRSLPPEAPTFLLTGDYNLRTLPDHMDFSTSVIPYTKAVEVVLSELIFIPFRQQYTDADCTNEFLKKFMRGEKDLTLGSFMIILSSSRETALRNFISRMYVDAATRMFGDQGLVIILNDEEMRDVRNKAAHDEVLSRDEAQQIRTWAMKLLGQV